MKIRDDHDSTKKQGQFLNFYNKLKLLSSIYQDVDINGIMWFVDDAFNKIKISIQQN